ncbi:MAG: alanine dehydrogenase [Anaerolineales bacterium]|nr:alanine dehydrogenase [Anaerolineae bacterium]PWB54451.1 MAG: alanine dehydrogenase [Anaerolineales bacterium]
MNICVPKERRTFEFRVGLTPGAVQMLTKEGHVVYVEHNAGVGAGFSDQEYEKAGARLVYTPHEVFGRADLLCKVARPTYEELEWLRSEITIMGLLHLFSSRQDKIDIIKEKNLTTISYEQIQLPDGSQPVRKPLSQIGGRLVAQIGAHLLQNDAGGKGIMLGGMGGVPPAEAVIIGAGISGTAAARSFLGVGAHLTMLDTNLDALQFIHETFPGVATMVSNPHNIARATSYADIVAACIQVPGDRPPIVISREMLRGMKPRSLIMDVSIDEGGCVETSRPTTHEHPTFIEEGIIHYCVPNMGSAVARTSTYAFLNAAFPFIKEIAEKGTELAIDENPAIETGALIVKGEVRRLPGMRAGLEEEE